MKNFLSAFLAIFFCLTVSTAQDTSAAVKPVTEASTSGYRLGVGDEIQVGVYTEPELSGKFTVDEDGKIQFPFAETPVSAMCKTDRELRAEVTTLLKKYLREPQVTISITEKRSRPPAAVYGEVRSPQQFDMRRSVRLMEILSYTGGFTEQASGAVQVFHTRPVMCGDAGEIAQIQAQPDNKLTVPMEVYRLSDLRAGKAESNPLVHPGDVIVVEKAAPIYIVGEVRSPQGVFIPERGLTLTDAVAMVGGLSERAKKKDVRIYRIIKGSSEREMISSNLELIKKGQQANPILQPYDIVEINKAPKSIGEILLGIATGAATTAGSSIGQLPLRVVY